MDIISVFAVLAFLFSAVAYVFYIKSVLASNAQPTISSWISWWLMDIAILAGIIAAGEMAWQMVAYIVGVVFVIGASVYKGAVVGWTRLDSVCLAIVIVAIGLWVISGDPNIAIVLSLVAITIGTIPMVVNIWRHPAREPLVPWFFFLAGGIFGVLAIPVWNIAAALTPVWFLVLGVLNVLLISRKLRSSNVVA